jgi:hypothetical protein
MAFDWSALYGLILQMFTQPPAEGLPAANSPSTQFQGDWPPGSFDLDVANAWSPSNPTGDYGLLEDISTLVNPIPFAGAVYQPSQITVEEVYGLILSLGYGTSPQLAAAADLVAPTVTVSQGDVEASALARARAANDYAMAAAAANARKASGGRDSPMDDAVDEVPGRDDANVQKLKTLHERMKAAGQDTSTGPSAFDVLSTQAKTAFNLAARASLSGNSTYRPSYLQPSDFATTAAASNWLTLQTTLKTGGQTARCSLSLKRLDIVRPWFNGLLIGLPNWTMDGFAKGQLSTQQFPLLPLSMIVSRNLSIKTDDGATSIQLPGLNRLGWFSEPQQSIPPE